MLKGLLGSVAALAAGAGLAWGQVPAVDPTPAAYTAPAGLPPAGPGAPHAALDPGVLPAGYAAPAGVAPDGFSGPGLFGGPPVNAGAGFYFERCGWARFEYLLWKMRNGPNPWPLVEHGTQLNGLDPAQPGSITLFGGGELDWSMSSGARVTTGAWLPGSTRVGVEWDGTILERNVLRRGLDAGSLGIPVLGIPFINELTGDIDGLFASQAPTPGGIVGTAKTQLYSTELNMLFNLYRRLYFTSNVLVGFRHLSLQEELAVLINSPGNPNGFFLGNPDAGPISMLDQFTTRNFFYGGNLGFQAQYRWRSLTLDYDARIAMGVMRRILDVTGRTTSGGTTVEGGLFAATTNMGQRHDNEFAAVPQIRGAVGWQALQCLRLHTGFDFLYVSSVIRPGDQIDPVVNPTLVPLRPEFGQALGTARPAPKFVSTDAWALGVSFGFTVRY